MSRAPSESTRRIYFHLAWAVAWAIVGCVVAVAIVLVRGTNDLGPLLHLSVLFAQVVGFSALASARLVFPRFAKLRFAVSAPLQVLTLFSGGVFGSASAFLIEPLYVLNSPVAMSLVVVVNGLLAIVVGLSIHTYDTMRRQIEESFVALRRKEALEREIEIARDVQHELLPRTVPVARGLDLAAVCRPAIGVGGDFYDFLAHGEDRVGIVIADVSGKGIPAALLMAGLQASVRSLAAPGISPAEVNRRVNDLLHESTSDARYATLFLALYDGRERTLRYSNAGHYPPVLLGRDGAQFLPASGLPIGALPGAAYGEGARNVEPGDILALYTDGIIEAPSRAGEEYGADRLVRRLAAVRGGSAAEALHAVLEDVARWTDGAPPHDDVTLVLARFS